MISGLLRNSSVYILQTSAEMEKSPKFSLSNIFCNSIRVFLETLGKHMGYCISIVFKVIVAFIWKFVQLLFCSVFVLFLFLFLVKNWTCLKPILWVFQLFCRCSCLLPILVITISSILKLITGGKCEKKKRGGGGGGGEEEGRGAQGYLGPHVR